MSLENYDFSERCWFVNYRKALNQGFVYILGIFGLSRSERLGRITFNQNKTATLVLHSHVSNLQPYIIFNFTKTATLYFSINFSSCNPMYGIIVTVNQY